VANLAVDPLQPELIGGFFGRQSWLTRIPILRTLDPRPRFALFAVAAVGAILATAQLDHGLTNPPGVATAVALLTEQSKNPKHIGLPLLQDPVGLIAIVMTLVAPILCCEQVQAIHGFNEMNERNITYRVKLLDVCAINSRTAQANDQFRMLGSRTGSVLLLLLSALLSFVIDYLVRRWGLLASWDHTLLPRSIWRREVYAGWWANPHEHFPLAVVLWCLGVYFFYFLFKQLLMGGIFALFVHRVMPLNFGVAPNMTANSDGYWGLRQLRRFMQMTYASTLGHFIMILGILVVWLPFNAFTVLIVTAVIIINGLVVIYPSQIALDGALKEKMSFVEHVTQSRRSRAERDAVIDKVWSTPSLPFKIRSTMTAGMLYLVIPLILALVSSLLGR
jgi:hypothetical protein